MLIKYKGSCISHQQGECLALQLELGSIMMASIRQVKHNTLDIHIAFNEGQYINSVKRRVSQNHCKSTIMFYSQFHVFNLKRSIWISLLSFLILNFFQLINNFFKIFNCLLTLVFFKFKFCHPILFTNKRCFSSGSSSNICIIKRISNCWWRNYCS